MGCQKTCSGSNFQLMVVFGGFSKNCDVKSSRGVVSSQAGGIAGEAGLLQESFRSHHALLGHPKKRHCLFLFKGFLNIFQMSKTTCKISF